MTTLIFWAVYLTIGVVVGRRVGAVAVKELASISPMEPTDWALVGLVCIIAVFLWPVGFVGLWLVKPLVNQYNKKNDRV